MEVVRCRTTTEGVVLRALMPGALADAGHDMCESAQPFLASALTYLWRISIGARVRSSGKTCTCHFTGTEVGR